ncbi:MAG: tripartite tricarboxylate transporter substrate binding protein [Pseudomonadota bacterium]|nr:tripartite tricarboxylate transporter substrate binding protein [Pseudomonadota bacterium]
MRRRHSLAALALFAAAPVFAQSAAYPTKPITIVVPYAAGGVADMVARTLGPKLTERLKQPVVVENVAGASGTIGAAKVVAAPADGYTLLAGSGSEVAIAKITNPAIKYDGMKDLKPVAMIGTLPLVLTGRADLPAKSLTELLAYARANPGKLSYGTPGIGTPQHLMGELVNLETGAKMVHVPYKGAGPLMNDLRGGTIDLAFLSVASVDSFLKAGTLRAYGVTERKRLFMLPNVPSLSEDKDFRNFDMNVWSGYFVPANTPDAVVKVLADSIHAILQEREVKAKLIQAGYQISSDLPGMFPAYIRAEAGKYRRVVNAANIRVLD